MIRLVVLFQMLLGRAGDYVAGQRRVLRVAMKDERGSVTIEHVLWAVAVLAFVAIVVGAIGGYINAKVGEIR